MVSNRHLVNWPSQEYFNKMVEAGILASYDISAAAREYHDALVEAARENIDSHKREAEFKRINRIVFSVGKAKRKD